MKVVVCNVLTLCSHEIKLRTSGTEIASFLIEIIQEIVSLRPMRYKGKEVVSKEVIVFTYGYDTLEVKRLAFRKNFWIAQGTLEALLF